MSHDFAPYKWSVKAEEAATLIADDKKTDEEIAAYLEIDRRTLTRWKAHPDFAARIAATKAAMRERVMTTGIADKANRVAALDDRWNRLRRVIDARAEDLAGEVPGGDTGLIVRKPVFVKVLSAPKGATAHDDLDDTDYTPTKATRLEYEYAVDTGVLSELRNIETAAAKELNQITEQINVKGDFDVKNLVKLSLDELRTMRELVARVGGETPVA